MEYIRKDGSKAIVNGDVAQYGNGPMKKNVIGANFINGRIAGGYLSSFDGSFTDELIAIQIGLGDIINTKIGDITDAYELLKSKISSVDIDDIFDLTSAVLETVNEYFNGFSDIDSRMSYYYTLDDDESQNNKISNLKGSGAAMCVERSALAQNLLKSLGINSIFKTSTIIKNGNNECHSYNLIEFNDKYYIFDASIPSLIDDKINPLVAEIDKDTFTLLSTPIYDFGISTTVSHYNPYRDMDVTITYDSSREKQIEVKPLGVNKKDSYNINKQIGAINSLTSGLSLLIITILIMVVFILNLILR